MKSQNIQKRYRKTFELYQNIFDRTCIPMVFTFDQHLIFYDKIEHLAMFNCVKKIKVLTGYRRIFTEQIQINFSHQF